MTDLAIRGGRVIDPVNKIDEIRDVAVRGGALVPLQGEARREIDAAGCIVVPGLIDLHVHLWPLMRKGVRAEACCFPSGVTYAADGGSAGWMNWPQFRAPLADMSIGVKSFVHVSAAGLNALGSVPEDIDPTHWDVEQMVNLVRENRRDVAGFKIRVGRETVGKLGMEPLRAAVAVARLTGTRLMVHPTGSEIPMREILDALGTGDILTHAFHGHGETLLGEGGMEAARRARARGVVLDIGDGCWHFSFQVYEAARRAGVWADTLSTDITANGLYQKPNFGFSLAYCMSRQLALGMPLEEILPMVTANAAKAMGVEGEAGALTPGMPADIAVLKFVERELEFRDGVGEIVRGKGYLRPMLTVKAGSIAYRDIEI